MMGWWLKHLSGDLWSKFQFSCCKLDSEEVVRISRWVCTVVTYLHAFKYFLKRRQKHLYQPLLSLKLLKTAELSCLVGLCLEAWFWFICSRNVKALFLAAALRGKNLSSPWKIREEDLWKSFLPFLSRNLFFVVSWPRPAAKCPPSLSLPSAVRRGENRRITVAWEDEHHKHRCLPLLAFPFPEFLLLSVTSYGIEPCCLWSMNINKMLGYIIFLLVWRFCLWRVFKSWFYKSEQFVYLPC